MNKSTSGGGGVDASRAIAHTILLFAACFSWIAHGYDDDRERPGWDLVVPSTSALPSISPSESFNRSVNNVLPLGTSVGLSEAHPARLQTNKFYSNFLVSAAAAAVGRTSTHRK